MLNKKTILTFAASALLAAVGSQANAAVIAGQLGVLDVSQINPATGVAFEAGDTYRLIFATSTGRDATSSNIADYNTFVQSHAAGSVIGTLSSVTWKAMASTETVDARDNTNTNSATDGPGESFWLLNGTSLVADDYADLYGSNTHDNRINIDDQLTAPFDGGDYTSVWTGSNSVGEGVSGYELGAASGTTRTGLWNFTSGAHWINRFNIGQGDEKGLYAVSEVLTVTPEPSSLALLGLGGLLVARRRRG